MPDRLASEATLLDLAMREHLALREEMADLRRQNFNLITSALVAAGGASAAVGAGAFGIPDGPRGLLLLAIAALTDVVCLGTVGVLNSCKIVELEIERTAEWIRNAALADGAASTAPFLRFHEYVRGFNDRALKRENKRVVGAWIASYGISAVIGGLVLGLIVVLVALGGWLAISQGQDSVLPGWLLLGLDLVLTGGLAILLAFSLVAQGRWGEFFFGSSAGATERSGVALPPVSSRDNQEGKTPRRRPPRTQP
jgi:hypothetical protein